MKGFESALNAALAAGIVAHLSYALLRTRRRLQILEMRQRRMMSDILALQRPPERYVHPFFEPGYARETASSALGLEAVTPIFGRHRDKN